MLSHLHERFKNLFSLFSFCICCSTEWCGKRYYEWHKGQNQKKYVAQKLTGEKKQNRKLNNTFIIYFNNFVKHSNKIVKQDFVFCYLRFGRSLSLLQKWRRAAFDLSHTWSILDRSNIGEWVFEMHE